jgi:hypothetical protein
VLQARTHPQAEPQPAPPQQQLARQPARRLVPQQLARQVVRRLALQRLARRPVPQQVGPQPVRRPLPQVTALRRWLIRQPAVVLPLVPSTA